MAFNTILEKFESNLWNYHICIPDIEVQPFLDDSKRRVICRLNDTVEFQCALMPKGDGTYFININKQLRDQLKLTVGTNIHVSLRKDTSKYGLPIPEEFAELLALDDEGNEVFHALTPGKQRSLLYIVGKIKSIQKRIDRAIIIIDYLKSTGGKLDFKELNQAIKEGIK